MADDEKCHVFDPSQNRPLKRRRVDPDVTRDLRESTYRELWNQQRERIQTVLDDANHATIDEILIFLGESLNKEGGASYQNRPIPAGFVLAGPDTTSHSAFFDQLSERLEKQSSTHVFVSLNSSECGNSLKGLLKSLVRGVVGDDDDLTVGNGTTRLLDYDLAILAARMKVGSRDGLVIALQDSEAFSSQVVSELVDLLSAWMDRIPVVLLFGIATSIEIFQDRMPRSALRCLRGNQFEVINSDVLLERIFSASVFGGGIPFRIGSDLANTLIHRQKSYIQSPSDFIDALQYAYMSHFFSNPLSIFLNDELELNEVTQDQFEAIRHTGSFRRYIESIIDTKSGAEEARKILESEKDLFQFVLKEVSASQAALDQMTKTVELLQSIRSNLPVLSNTPTSKLYIQALGGDLQNASALRETLLTLKKSPSDQLQMILASMHPFLTEDGERTLDQFEEKLNLLLSEAGTALKSQYDVKNQTLRTTVVAQRVELSKHKAKVTEHDTTYSELLDSVYEWLKSYFVENLLSSDDVLFSEVFVYNSKRPDRLAFMPGHRQAIEKALSTPHAYLNCDCCKTDSQTNGEGTIYSTQPPTALLYQLYLESGSSINVSDLWTAFKGVRGTESEEEEEETMFLFQRALAELSYLGMVKSTRRKQDHIVKASWKGL